MKLLISDTHVQEPMIVFKLAKQNGSLHLLASENGNRFFTILEVHSTQKVILFDKRLKAHGFNPLDESMERINKDDVVKI